MIIPIKCKRCGNHTTIPAFCFGCLSKMWNKPFRNSKKRSTRKLVRR